MVEEDEQEREGVECEDEKEEEGSRTGRAVPSQKEAASKGEGAEGPPY